MNRIKAFVAKLRKKREYHKQNISIAKHVDIKNVTFEDYVNLAHHAQVGDATIGKRTSIGRYSKVRFADIGRYCSISWDVTIGAIEHPIHAISTHAFPYRKQFGICSKNKEIEHRRVTIGNDVWIGCGAIIMPGVTIGDGAIIGAGGVVTHDVSSYEIVAGCPAKHITWRFSDDQIVLLNKIKWWNAPDEFLINNIDMFDPENNLLIQNDYLLRLDQEISKYENK